MSCNHLNTKHNIYLKCCNKYYNCYYCHNENNDHIVKKKDILKIRCNECYKEQELSNKCINCGIKFAKYYCNKCKYWSNEEIYHCNKCNICYIKTSNELIHCDECNKCYNKEIYDFHICSISKDNYECQICFENFKKSNEKCYFLKCQHKIHVSCYNKYKEYCKNNNKIFNCGICRKKL